MNNIKKQEILSKKQECKKFIKEFPEMFDEEIQDLIVIGIYEDGSHQMLTSTMWDSKVISHLEIAKHMKLDIMLNGE